VAPSEKELLKKARITAMSLGFFCIIALVSLVYAIVQKTKLENCEAYAIVQKTKSEQSEAIRLAQESKSAKEIEMVTTKLEAALAELEKCRQK